MCCHSHLLPAGFVEVLATEARGDEVATEGGDESDCGHKPQQRADQIHQQRHREFREGPHSARPGPCSAASLANRQGGQKPLALCSKEWPLPTGWVFPHQSKQIPTTLTGTAPGAPGSLCKVTSALPHCICLPTVSSRIRLAEQLSL